MNMERVYALGLPGNGSISGPDKLQLNSIGDIISEAIPYVFLFAGIALLLMLISAGFTLLTSAGDAKKLDSGKQTLTYALVGFLLIFAAFWIVQLAGIIFGIEEINSIF